MQTHDDPEQLLQEPHIAVLATVDARGRPHAAPMWYLYEDGALVMSTGRGSRKHRNLERNPHATLVVDRRSPPYYAVMVHGTAELGPPLDAAARPRLAARYLDAETARDYVARTTTADAGSVTIRLRPEKIVEFRGSAGRDEQ
jgi:PPOX class probable F420-dependent enzyme